MTIYEQKEECTGCGACVNICPNHCIKLQYDKEGFLYPVVDESQCVHCGCCNSVCHMKKTYKHSNIHTEKYYAAYCKKSGLVKKSSSGGVFSALAYSIIKAQGVVYGVVQNNLYDVHHQRAETWEECKKFRKSKYLESNTGFMYQNVKKDLQSKRKVLFTGTGCQIAGLYEYLGEKYENLITCEVVCHGVPSMYVFKKYIKEMEKRYGSNVTEFCFRDKVRGWIPNFETISFASGKKITSGSGENPFHSGYLKGLYSRPSCGKCRYATLPRIADITLADFWKYNGRLKKQNQNRGISLVILSAESGIELFEKAKLYLKTDEVRSQDAIRSCYHLTHAPEQSEKRNSFMGHLENRPFWYLRKRYSKG